MGLLLEVQIVWDLRSIRVVRPRSLLRVRHDSDMYEGGLVEGGIDPRWEFLDEERVSEFVGREALRVMKAQGEPAEQ